MILEYKYLIGFYCLYQNMFDSLCTININNEKITMQDFFSNYIKREYVKNIELQEHGLKIEYIDQNGDPYIIVLSTQNCKLGKEIKSYYLYTKRKSIIGNI